MPKRVTYNIDEILKVLNKTKSWRAVDRHYGKGHNTVKNWLSRNGVKIKEFHFFDKI